MSTPHLVNHFLPHSDLHIFNSNHLLLCDILAPPMFDIYHDRALLTVGKLTNLPPQVKEGPPEGISRYGKSKLDEVFSGFLCGIIVALYLCYFGKDFIKGYRLLGDLGCLFTALTCTAFCFTSYCFLLFLATMQH